MEDNFDENLNHNLNHNYGIELKPANEKFRGCSQNILFYSYLLAWGGLVYGFIQNRILSNRVNKLQGKVDNLYQKINDSVGK